MLIAKQQTVALDRPWSGDIQGYATGSHRRHMVACRRQPGFRRNTDMIQATDPMYDVRGNPSRDDGFDTTATDGFVYSYDPENWLTAVSYSSVDNPYFFTGRTTDTLHTSSILVSTDPNFKRLQDNRNRTYDPKHGRWLQRDPISPPYTTVSSDGPAESLSDPDTTRQYTDGADLYQYAKGKPTGSTDDSGLITVIETGSASGACGAVTRTYKFRLPMKAKREGYIVQLVTATAFCCTCVKTADGWLDDHCADGTNRDSLHDDQFFGHAGSVIRYLEFLRVPKDSYIPAAGNDYASHRPDACTLGLYRQTGQTRFFYKDDLDKAKVDIGGYKTGEVGEFPECKSRKQTSGSWPHFKLDTDAPPDWWDTLAVKEAGSDGYRSMYTRWDCCGHPFWSEPKPPGKTPQSRAWMG